MKSNRRILELILSAFLVLIICAGISSATQAGTGTQSSCRFQQVAISADGGWVAWVEQTLDSSGEPTTSSAIFVRELSSAWNRPRRISASSASNSEPIEDSIAWSPDSKRLAFLSDVSGQAQLYVADVGTGEARKLTTLTGYLTSPAW